MLRIRSSLSIDNYQKRNFAYDWENMFNAGDDIVMLTLSHNIEQSLYCMINCMKYCDIEREKEKENVSVQLAF